MPEPPGTRMPGEPPRRPADSGPRPAPADKGPGKPAGAAPAGLPRPASPFGGQGNMDDMLAEARAALAAGRFEEGAQKRAGRVSLGLRTVVLLGGFAGLTLLAVFGYQVGPEYYTWWRLESAIDEVILDVQTAPERRVALAMGQPPPDILPILRRRITRAAQVIRPGFSPDELRIEEAGETLYVSIRWEGAVDLVAYRLPLAFEVSRKVPTKPSVLQPTD